MKNETIAAEITNLITRDMLGAGEYIVTLRSIQVVGIQVYLVIYDCQPKAGVNLNPVRRVAQVDLLGQRIPWIEIVGGDIQVRIVEVALPLSQREHIWAQIKDKATLYRTARYEGDYVTITGIRSPGIFEVHHPKHGNMRVGCEKLTAFVL